MIVRGPPDGSVSLLWDPQASVCPSSRIPNVSSVIVLDSQVKSQCIGVFEPPGVSVSLFWDLKV